MKELSIEEKAKRYDKAIKIAKEINNEQRAQPFNVMIRVFPELKDEDERIRKEIIEQINLLKSATLSDLRDKQFDSWITWLEKQGEKDEEILILKDQIESLHAAIKAIKETHRIELKKQGEQKPTDKVEPIVVKDFNSVFSREHVEEIDKRIEKSQRLYNAKLRDAMQKVEDFPMID